MVLEGGIGEARITRRIRIPKRRNVIFAQLRRREVLTSMDIDIKEAITKAITNLNSKLEKHPKERSQPTIYRVHRHLREVNRTAYEPEVISIGPYHRGKDHLKMMEDHKLLMLQLLVETKGIDIMKGIAKAVGGVASQARKCYAHQDLKLSKSEFIEMLVLDGCFIIEFVQRYALKNEAHPIFQMDWMIHSLLRDLMLFENQVPFFVLLEVFNLIYPQADSDLEHILFFFFNNLYSGSKRSDKEVEMRLSELVAPKKIMHILDLVHRNWLPRESQKSEEENDIKKKAPESQESEEEKSDHAITIERKGHESQESEEEKSGNIKTKARESQKSEEEKSGSIKRKARESQKSEEEKSDTDTKGKKDTEFMYCATRLTDANVKFKVKKEATCLFDIEFKGGTMVMPSLHIDDMTECLFRNLIAYEQYFKKAPHNLVTQYMTLLDSLINSSKDMEILSRNRIITHVQGDDEVVANMVNKLGDSIVSNFNFNKYAQLYENVNDHCRKPKNSWMAKLRRDYLNGPWAIISILAAVVLLLLTVMQTVLSLLQVI